MATGKQPVKSESSSRATIDRIGRITGGYLGEGLDKKAQLSAIAQKIGQAVDADRVAEAAAMFHADETRRKKARHEAELEAEAEKLLTGDPKFVEVKGEYDEHPLPVVVIPETTLQMATERLQNQVNAHHNKKKIEALADEIPEELFRDEKITDHSDQLELKPGQKVIAKLGENISVLFSSAPKHVDVSKVAFKVREDLVGSGLDRSDSLEDAWNRAYAAEVTTVNTLFANSQDRRFGQQAVARMLSSRGLIPRLNKEGLRDLTELLGKPDPSSEHTLGSVIGEVKQPQPIPTVLPEIEIGIDRETIDRETIDRETVEALIAHSITITPRPRPALAPSHDGKRDLEEELSNRVIGGVGQSST